MKQGKSPLIKALLAACVLFANSCSAAAEEEGAAAHVLPGEVVLVGSTPGDHPVKSMLAIGPDKKVDFIRWDLALNEAAREDSKIFVLNITFGEGEPNTPGFKGGGEKLFVKGGYTVSKSGGAEIYRLKGENSAAAFSLVKLNESLFHLIAPAGRLLVGNGGWSYTLSRKDSPKDGPSSSSPVWAAPSLWKAGPRAVFDGRTPCLDFVVRYNLRAGDDCRKLKWSLILNRDPATGEPTTYSLRGTLYRQNQPEGKWAVVKGLEGNPAAVIYRLEPDKAGEPSISFLVGDENVLFFLDPKQRLMTGDENFSFTLNRRNDGEKNF